jgi:hypothetical protein
MMIPDVPARSAPIGRCLATLDQYHQGLMCDRNTDRRPIRQMFNETRTGSLEPLQVSKGPHVIADAGIEAGEHHIVEQGCSSKEPDRARCTAQMHTHHGLEVRIEVARPLFFGRDPSKSSAISLGGHHPMEHRPCEVHDEVVEMIEVATDAVDPQANGPSAGKQMER